MRASSRTGDGGGVCLCPILRKVGGERDIAVVESLRVGDHRAIHATLPMPEGLAMFLPITMKQAQVPPE